MWRKFHVKGRKIMSDCMRKEVRRREREREREEEHLKKERGG